MAPDYGPGGLLPLSTPLLYWAALRLTPRTALLQLTLGHVLAFGFTTAALWLATLVKLSPHWQAMFLPTLIPLLLLALAGGRQTKLPALLLHWLAWQALFWSFWGALILLEG